MHERRRQCRLQFACQCPSFGHTLLRHATEWKCALLQSNDAAVYRMQSPSHVRMIVTCQAWSRSCCLVCVRCHVLHAQRWRYRAVLPSLDGCCCCCRLRSSSSGGMTSPGIIAGPAAAAIWPWVTGGSGRLAPAA